MKVMNISRNRFNHLEPFILDKTIYNTEAKLYFFQDKNKWDRELKLFKRLYVCNGESFGNKLYTINSLIDNKNSINIEELVFPEKLIAVNSELVGFTMPYIPNKNLGIVLKDYDVPNKQKIEYLKQLGIILEKMKILRNHSNITDFFINDLHEGNVIINEKDKINIVDLDSCKINDNKPAISKYLSPFSPINRLKTKYHSINEPYVLGSYIPDENSDLYCYTIIILNFLFKSSVLNLSFEEYNLYLQYLLEIGIPFELVDKFEKIYQYVDNENIYEMLEMLNNDSILKANRAIFNAKMKKKTK